MGIGPGTLEGLDFVRYAAAMPAKWAEMHGSRNEAGRRLASRQRPINEASNVHRAFEL